MRYVSSITVSGPPEAAMTVVRDALVANGFTIANGSRTGFTATGPGLMNSNQNAILGVSKAIFQTDGNVLHVDADLGGAARLGQFAMFFPFALGLLLATIFGVIWGTAKPMAMLIPLLAVSPWVIIGPLMARLIRKRSESAVQALLQSAASIADISQCST